MKIVALIPGTLEEQIFFFPTLDALKQAYPNAEIDVVVEPRAKSIYRLSKSVQDTIPFDFQANSSPADWANLLGVLRDRYYDIGVTLTQSSTSGLLLWLAGTPVRLGFAPFSKLFLTSTVPYKPDQYRPQVYHDLLSGLGITTPAPNLAITLSRKDLDWAEAEQKRLGLAGGGYVLLYDNGAAYPTASWQTIIQDFQQKQPGLPLVLLRDSGNGDWANELAQAFPKLVVTRPEDAGLMAAIVAGANLMLGTVGLPVQLAIALNVYTLALLGPESPSTLLPSNEKFVGLAAPDGKWASLTPETVLQKVWGG
ncbi:MULTISPECIES: glycosyltransferase family 9 protein [unclassified Leptolyngbya]|uniref:glycosyltransferase family 9 protein n=1 Tax=unclassified Leptolyngbya TaxID=2650499 RepID=UPI00168341BB|nr:MULTISPECIES: glycosyltransferase family 9 protein [unclassified Leptolyngbya]MBD1911968.1 glycosyltransferase family 9 protein [Leptolyngbya sp. FACHB-8]MBD2157096.1 glycosyltransferase family 9 protein [Leptolyngbya sp. FACHB-16]